MIVSLQEVIEGTILLSLVRLWWNIELTRDGDHRVDCVYYFTIYKRMKFVKILKDIVLLHRRIIGYMSRGTKESITNIRTRIMKRDWWLIFVHISKELKETFICTYTQVFRRPELYPVRSYQNPIRRFKITEEV